MNGAQFQRAVTVAFAPGTLWADIAPKVAAFARQDRDAKIAAGEFPRSFRTLVNGQEGAREEAIQPDGVIFYEGRSLGAAIALAVEELRKRAPVLTGHYRDSLMVGVTRGGSDGSPIPWKQFRPEAVSADATAAYVLSPEPYSRLLDVQMEGSRPIKVRVPAGFIADAAAAVRRAFPQLRAERLYTVRHPWAQRRRSGKKIEYPAIRISVG